MHFYRCVTVFVLFAQILLDAGADQPTKQTALTISVETTRIIRPLDQAGFVDYVRAVDETASEGVTADNNFEVVMRRVMGYEEISEGMRARYFKQLGIPIPRGPFYKAFAHDQHPDQYNRAYAGPWITEDLPEVAEWLDLQNARLDAIVEGSRRLRNYTPYNAEEPTDDEQDYPRMIAMLLPAVQSQREVARGLMLRANLRVGEGDLEGAWEDVRAIYRVSRLTAQGVTLIEALVGIAIDSIAFNAATKVLQSPELTDEQIRRFFKDLMQLPPLPTVASKIDVGERYMGLDAVQMLARTKNMVQALKMISELSSNDAPRERRANGTTLVVFQNDAPPEKAEPKAGMTKVINWDATAKLLNKWYDRIVVASNQQGYAKRKQLFASIDQDIQKLKTEMSPAKLALGVLATGTPDATGELIGNVLVALLVPAVDAATTAHHRAMAQMDVLRVAFAAEIYARERGRYPADLSKLKPDYLTEIPMDRFSDNPLRFVAGERKLVIYSVGSNGRDDQGRGYQDAEEKNSDAGWDDLVVRLELP